MIVSIEKDIGTLLNITMTSDVITTLIEKDPVIGSALMQMIYEATFPKYRLYIDIVLKPTSVIALKKKGEIEKKRVFLNCNTQPLIKAH